MISRRLLATGLVAGALALGTAGVAAAQTTTPPTAAPAPGACTEGVTFTLLKKVKPGHVEIKDERANIRNLPGTDCVIYDSKAKGTKLKTTGRRAKASKLTWVEIFTPKLGHAWVAANLVKKV
jgi:hypothetical protein